jgi:hypothetical protein
MFLQAQIIDPASVTLTADSHTDIALDSLRGTSAALIFGVRTNSATATGSADKKWLHLGDTATVDIVDSGGISVWSRGDDVQANLLLGQTYALQSLGKLGCHRALYCMNFCDSMLAAFNGSYNGGMQFNPSVKLYLRIKCGAAGTATVQTITGTNATNATGSYQFNYRGHTTDALGVAANVAGIKAALETLPSMKQQAYGPLTVTANSTLESKTTTLTFSNNTFPPNGEEYQVRVVSDTTNLSADAAAPTNVDNHNTATSTQGVGPGWTTGSNYQVVVLAYMYKNLQRMGGMSGTVKQLQTVEL